MTHTADLLAWAYVAAIVAWSVAGIILFNVYARALQRGRVFCPWEVTVAVSCSGPLVWVVLLVTVVAALLHSAVICGAEISRAVRALWR